MARYNVTGAVTISVYTIVEADSPEQARQIAAERGNSSSIVEQGNDNEEWVTGSELDGVVTVVQVDEVDDLYEDEDD